MKLGNYIGLKNKVLNEYDQVLLFAKYLQVEEIEIERCLMNRYYKTLNIHRGERNASLSFMYKNGKVIAKDFADRRYDGDIFAVVGFLMNKNVNVNDDFVAICKTILNNDKPNSDNIGKIKSVNKITDTKEFTPIYRDWNPIDVKFWTSNLFIPIWYLESNHIYPIERLICNGKVLYKYDKFNPCYLYYHGTRDGIEIYKIYIPYNKIKHNKKKFMSNNKSNFGQFYKIGKRDNLILVKSDKDAILINYILNHRLTHPFLPYRDSTSIIPLTSESVRLTQNHVDILNSLYTNIISFVDNDQSGNDYADYHYDNYNMNSVMFNDGIFEDIKEKDISDYVVKQGTINGAEQVVINIINTYLND